MVESRKSKVKGLKKVLPSNDTYFVTSPLDQKEKERRKALFFGNRGVTSVTASGFKPETFSSVVRCSIQLSYAASILNNFTFFNFTFFLHDRLDSNLKPCHP